jgi:hypothetical protein
VTKPRHVTWAGWHGGCRCERLAAYVRICDVKEHDPACTITDLASRSISGRDSITIVVLETAELLSSMLRPWPKNSQSCTEICS